MKLSGKMTKRFILYFLTFYGILFIGTTLLISIFVYKLMIGFYFHDIRALEQIEVELAIEQSGNSYTLSKSLVEIAERSGGIVQLLDSDGTVLVSSREDVFPAAYTLEQLKSFSLEKDSRTWLLENGQIVLFQQYTQTDELLSALQAGSQFPEITEQDRKLLNENRATFQVFSNNGELRFSTSTLLNQTLDLEDILGDYTSMNERKELISYASLPNGDLAVVRMNNPNYQALDSLDNKLIKEFLIWFVGYHLLLLVFTLAFSLWVGRQFGKPVFFFLKWIEQLSKKDYRRLDSRKIRNKKDGRLKRGYRIYEDVDYSLARLTDNLEDNERTIERTERLREDWITGLSHDLKTPLSSIYGYAAFLASEHRWSPDEVKSFAATMMEKAGYMDSLINDLTYTYQLKNDGVVLEKKQTNFYEYLLDYVKKSDWRETVILEGEETGVVDIDQARFGRVLDNVVGNAIKHNPRGTVIYLQLSINQTTVQLIVRDEGKGIPDEQLENLFDRYYRGTNTTTDGEGTGLGLTIAKQLVEAHQGKIEAASSPSGTAITICLPRYQ